MGLPVRQMAVDAKGDAPAQRKVVQRREEGAIEVELMSFRGADALDGKRYRPRRVALPGSPTVAPSGLA